MSINDSIENSTIDSTAPTEGAVEQGVSQGVGINQEQPAIGTPAFATRVLTRGKLRQHGDNKYDLEEPPALVLFIGNLHGLVHQLERLQHERIPAG